MALLKLQTRKTGPVALTASGIFLTFCILYFSGAAIPHKITFPLATLAVASLWLCPWQMTLALLFSAVGDYLGSWNNFLGQMGFFAADGLCCSYGNRGYLYGFRCA